MSGRRRIARRWQAAGFWLAVLAVTAHLSVGALLWPVGPATAQARALDRLQTLCLGHDPAPAHAPRPVPDAPALCPLATSSALSLWLPEAGPDTPPPPAALRLAGTGEDAERAMPARASDAAWPRGPPRSA